MQDEEIQLENCPFCGGKAHIVLKQFDLFNVAAVIECEKCKARTDLYPPKIDNCAKDEAAAAWNRRTRSEYA